MQEESLTKRFLARFGAGDARVGAGLGAILIGAAVVYLPALGNEFVFDDRPQILDNPFLSQWWFVPRSFLSDVVWFRDPAHLPQSPYYRPMHDLWLWINFQLFGFHPLGWHAAMIALHLLTLWLVFRAAVKLSGNRWTGLLATALFASMPIHAGVVAYPAAIGAALSATFELAAFDSYLRWRAIRGAGMQGYPTLVFSLAMFAGALLSYEGSAVFPGIIVAYALLLEPIGSEVIGAGIRIEAVARGAAASTWPYVVEAIAYLGIRYTVIGAAIQRNVNADITMKDALLTIPGMISDYAALLVFPWRAAPAHGLAVVRSAVSPAFILPLIGLAAVITALCLAILRNPHRRLYLFCAAWIAAAIAPMLDLPGLSAQEFVQDRYLYLASFAPCLMIADIVVCFASWNPRWIPFVAAGAAVATIGSAIFLFSAERYWRDDVTLFSRCVVEAPRSFVWRQRLGLALRARSDINGARRELEMAAKLAPTDGQTLYQLGRVYARLNASRRAESLIAAGLKRLDFPPPGGYAELALAADASGDTKQSEAAIEEAQKLPGGGGAAAIALAQIKFRHGDSHGAETILRNFLKTNSGNPEALAVLGAVLSAEHRYDEALAAVRQAAQADPSQPLLHYLIALALHQMGRDPEARAECAVALSGEPNDPGARDLMAILSRAPATNGLVR